MLNLFILFPFWISAAGLYLYLLLEFRKQNTELEVYVAIRLIGNIRNGLQ